MTNKAKSIIDEETARKPRTQEARRSATIARLTDAAIDSLVEFGYAKASTNDICKRAGVSQGALFRHFPSRGDFMAHVAEELLARQIQNFEDHYMSDESLPGDPLERAVRFTRLVCRSDWAKAWVELVVSSRTDEQIRTKVFEVYQKVRIWTRRAARNVFPANASYDLDRFHAVVDTVLWMFEMEGIYSHLDVDDESAEQRIRFAVDCYRRFFEDQGISFHEQAHG